MDNGWSLAASAACQGRDRRFKVQQIAPEAWDAAVRVNLVADHLAGYPDVASAFVRSRPQWNAFGRFLEEADRSDLVAYQDAHRDKSLAFVAMMLTGACNADCPICFTDRRRKRAETSDVQRDRLLGEAAALGARYVYVAGEGEPTIDRHWWAFLDSCARHGLEAVVFTNGLIFQDDRVCQRYWGMTVDQAIARLSTYPVSLYVKFWTARADLAATMLGLPASKVLYAPVDGLNVPLGLARLMDGLPRQRLGIEVVVEGRNAEEVAGDIAPFADRHGLAALIELLQHNGRVLETARFDPTPAQADLVSSWLSPTSCAMAPCKVVVTSQGLLSPRIGIMEHQIPSPARHIDEASLWSLLHETEYLVRRRYQLECLCEQEPARLARNRSETVVRPYSIVPRAAVAARQGVGP